MSSTAQRVTGAWLDGYPVGDRRFVDLPGLTLELGDTLPGVRLAYESWGRLSRLLDRARRDSEGSAAAERAREAYDLRQTVGRIAALCEEVRDHGRA